MGVGGQPASYTSGGYNGGGAGRSQVTAKFYDSGGGGGTHIAYGSTNRGVMSGYADYSDELLVIAGGGGGGSIYVSAPLVGGTGGGTTIGNVQHSSGGNAGDSKTAKSNGILGQGDNNCGSGYNSGRYQQTSGNVYSGSGATGYVKSGLTSSSQTTGSRSGNGQAKITWVSY